MEIKTLNYEVSLSEGGDERIDLLEQGKHKYYFRTGRVMLEGKYSLGLKQGDWKKYNELGELLITIKYKDGVEIKYDGTKIKPALEYSDEG